MSRDERRALLERPVMREEFRKELRARLMSEAQTALAPRPRVSFFSAVWLRPALAAVVVAVVVLAGATSAAARSLPGDPLYGLKRAAENVQVALTFDDVARMQLLSDLADRRLDELAEVAGQRPAAAPTATAHYADAVERFADAVDTLRDAESEDKRDAAESVANAAREKHVPVLEAVKEKVPDHAKDDVQKVIEKEQQRMAPADNPGRRPESPGRPTPRR